MVLVKLDLDFELDLPNGGWGPGNQNGGGGRGGPQGGDDSDEDSNGSDGGGGGGGGGDEQVVNMRYADFEKLVLKAELIFQSRLQAAVERRKRKLKKIAENAPQMFKSTLMKKMSRKKRSQIQSPQMTKFLFRELSPDVQLDTVKGGDKKKMCTKALPLPKCEIASNRNLEDALLMCNGTLEKTSEKALWMPEKNSECPADVQEHSDGKVPE